MSFGQSLIVNARPLVYARIRITREQMEAARFRSNITMEEILGGSIGGGVEPTAPPGDYANQKAMLNVSEPPTIKQRLEHEIAITESRLVAMKAGLAVIENAPALEVLQRALAAVNRHNY